MAIVKRAKPIMDRLDVGIAYATDPKKTALQNALDYASDSAKTEQFLYVGCINCSGVERAYSEMQEVKERYNKTGGRLAYSFIQSFAAGEVTPEQAHMLGMRLASLYFGDRFQVVVGTHLNTDHLHNHIVVNSVDLDGNKYRDKLASLDELRQLSDSLCREYDLSVVKEQNRNSALPYKEHKAKQSGQLTRNDVIRADIDDAIKKATSFIHFTALMKSMGYKLKYGPGIKYMTLTPPGAERARRVYKLGSAYSEEAIRQRIQEQVKEPVRESGMRNPIQPPYEAKKSRYIRLRGKKYKPIKLKGMQARYYRVMYALGWIRKHPRANREVFFMRYKELCKLNAYSEHFRYCRSRGISTGAQMQVQITNLQAQIASLEKARNVIYAERRKAKASLRQDELDEMNRELKSLRKELRLCRTILTENMELERRQHEKDEKEKSEKGGTQR